MAESVLNQEEQKTDTSKKQQENDRAYQIKRIVGLILIGLMIGLMGKLLKIRFIW